MRFSHRTMITLSGLVWLAVGLVLLPLGLRFLAQEENITLSIGLIVLGLTVGYFKGKKVLAKVAVAQATRIATLPNPAPVSQLYTPRYYLLLASMIGLGMAVKWLPLPVRGFIDVAVGSALINGAMTFFRLCGKASQTES